ncbi:MAG: nuclear transport factor 2 family protein [Phycisphaerae bacterium]|nr:nuclear transport factor 2 family protein [Phycisphaerae bacterium]
MSFLTRILFEDLAILLMIEFLVLMSVLAVHRRRMTPRTRRAVYITLACCAAVIALNKLVSTDGERIVETVSAIAKAVDEGDVPAIAEDLDDEFRYRHWDKDGFVAELNSKLQRWRIDEVKVGRFETRVDGDVATTSFRASCDWRGGHDSQAGVASAWTLELVRRPGGWKLRRVVSAKVGPGYKIDLNDVWNY